MDSDECSLCFRERETTDHIPFNCHFASRVWDLVFEWGGWSGMQVSSIIDMLNWPLVSDGEFMVYLDCEKLVHFQFSYLSIHRVMVKIQVNKFLKMKYRSNCGYIVWQNCCNRPSLKLFCLVSVCFHP